MVRLPNWKPNGRDWLLCAAVVLCALLLGWRLWFSPAEGGGTAVVLQDGAVLARLPLKTDTTYVVEGTYENVIRVKDGKVFIESSTCPGQDCVHQGAVSRPGSSIVCLPNHVAVYIEGGDADVTVG